MSGRFVNFQTKEPLAAIEVILKANDVHSASSYAVGRAKMGTAITDENGYFYIRSQQSRDHPRYYLWNTSSGSRSMYDTTFIVNSERVDLGTLFSGSHNFKFEVLFVPTTGHCANVHFTQTEVVFLNSGAQLSRDYEYFAEYAQIKYAPAVTFTVDILNCWTSQTLSTTPYILRFPENDKKTIQVGF